MSFINYTSFMIVQSVYMLTLVHMQRTEDNLWGPTFFSYHMSLEDVTLVMRVGDKQPTEPFWGPQIYTTIPSILRFIFWWFFFFQKPFSVYLVKNQITGQENPTLETKSFHREQQSLNVALKIQSKQAQFIGQRQRFYSYNNSILLNPKFILKFKVFILICSLLAVKDCFQAILQHL